MQLKKVITKLSERMGLVFIGKYLEHEYYNKKRTTYLALPGNVWKSGSR